MTQRFEAQARRAVEEVYTDPRSGFGSMANTLKAARTRSPFVTREDSRSNVLSLRWKTKSQIVLACDLQIYITDLVEY